MQFPFKLISQSSFRAFRSRPRAHEPAAAAVLLITTAITWTM
jgi:hypothetical protein